MLLVPKRKTDPDARSGARGRARRPSTLRSIAGERGRGVVLATAVGLALAAGAAGAAGPDDPDDPDVPDIGSAAADALVGEGDTIAIASDAALAAIAPRAVRAVYRPLHAAFAGAADRLDGAVDAFCGSPDAATLDAARAAWRDAVPAFAAIEPLRVGPVIEENRINRVFFWPDSRRAGERQLRALLAEPGPLDAAGIAGKSVAVQGLPALERLLYAKGIDADPAAAAAATCRVAVAVAGNVSGIAAELHAAWDAPEKADGAGTDGGIGARMISPAADDPLFRSESEVLRSLLTQLQAGLESVAGPKLAPVVDGDANGVRALPFTRSGLYPEYLDGNLDGLAALLLDGGIADAAGVADEAKFELGNARRLLGKLAGELSVEGAPGEAPSADAADTARALRAGVTGLERLALDRVAPALGTRTGFNSADGD